MAGFLYRIGRGAVRRRRWVLAGWLLVLIGVAVAASAFAGSTSESFEIPGTESQKASDLLAERFDGLDADAAGGTVVFVAPDGATLHDPEVQGAVEESLANLEDGPQVSGVTDPYQLHAASAALGSDTPFGISADGTIGYTEVTFDGTYMDITDEAKDALATATEPARDAGVTTEFGGSIRPGASDPEPGSSEALGLLVAIVVLLLSFGSLVAAGLPIITALVGVGTGLSGIALFSAVADMSSTAPILATMIGLAVGIDYALFIVSRHRQNLAAGMSPIDAASHATATAGSAVMFAALTVIVALCGLTVVNIPFLTVMALAAAVTVLIAAIISVTLLPALLGFAGHVIDRVRIPGVRLHQAGNAVDGFGTRWAKGIVRRPVIASVAVIAVLGVVAVPATSLELGLPSDGTAPPDTTQRRAYDLLSEGFGPGFNGPLMMVVDAQGADDPEAVTTTAAARVDEVEGVVLVTPPQFNDEGDTAIFIAYPSTGPAEAETTHLVHDIREAADKYHDETGAEVAVTGNTAVNIDVSDRLTEALPVFAVVVVLLSLVILMIAFRSILVPIKATLGFLFTIAASFGAVVAVFQWGWLSSLLGVDTTGPIVSFLPILMMAVLFGLAMDYEVFLVSRMREEVSHGTDPVEAIVAGFTGGARVVTAAALIMTSVFAAFMLDDDVIVKSMGFALAFGVLVDAFIVRMTLVPAVLALFGRSAWWIPKWLDRVLPTIDVEGEGFETEEEEPAKPVTVG